MTIGMEQRRNNSFKQTCNWSPFVICILTVLEAWKQIFNGKASMMLVLLSMMSLANCISDPSFEVGSKESSNDPPPTVQSLEKLNECKADAFRDPMTTFNERQREVSEVCDDIQLNIGRFTAREIENAFVKWCEKVKASEPKVLNELLNVRNAQLDTWGNCKQVNQLYNFIDTNYVSLTEIAAHEVTSFHMKRFINEMNNLMNAGVSVADSNTAIDNMLANRIKSFVLYYNSSQILNPEESDEYIIEFEWNAQKLVAMKEADNDYQFIIIDCAKSRDVCPHYGGLEYSDLHISEYRYKSVNIEDLMYFWAWRKDYCGTTKLCHRPEYYNYSEYPCNRKPVYPFCIRPPTNLDMSEVVIA